MSILAHRCIYVCYINTSIVLFYFVYGRCQRQQIPFSIWSVIEDRRRVLQRRLVGRGYLKLAIEHQLDRLDANWRTVVQAQLWEEEYNHAMEAVSVHWYPQGSCNVMANPNLQRKGVNAE